MGYRRPKLSVRDARLLFAAHVMLAMEEIRMSSNELKQALRHIPGAENLTINYAPISGNMLVTVGGRTVEVRPTASNAEIVLAFSNPAISIPAPIPAPITQVRTPKMASITGASSASMTIKDLIAGSRNAVQAAHNKLIANAGKVQDAAGALNGLGDDLGAEADDLMSMIGQFKNDLTPSTPTAPATPLPAA